MKIDNSTTDATLIDSGITNKTGYYLRKAKSVTGSDRVHFLKQALASLDLAQAGASFTYSRLIRAIGIAEQSI